MNKKIYLNNKFIVFEPQGLDYSDDPSIAVYADDDEKKMARLVPDFLNPAHTHSIRVIMSQPFEKLLNKIKKPFAYIEAAGGFIEKENEFLFIHRHGRWDLPKGKLEKNETIESAAVRECEEECGVRGLRLAHQLPSTFHIYPYKAGFALKQTYWFYMNTDYNQALKPQLEEDIDQVRWFDKKEIREQVLADTYYTISDTVKSALSL